ncbi:MAG: hypothetical protein QOI29_1646, partial [Mycobacterium sp.]|nr:hypothetical protein [Mycobacterium sp.]
MMLPPRVSRSTMAAHKRGSVKFFVQEEKLSLDAMATEFFSSRAHVIVGVPWKDAVISHLEPRSASCVTEDVWTCALCAVAYTPEDLATLLADKLPCWRWAAFASVLVQRRAEVQSRLRDSQLGYGRPTGERADSGVEVGRFVVDRMEELLTLVDQVESFMLTPAFVGVFGDPGDESSADADGILHVAGRLMDYHER